ncbi:MAG: arsenate reductase (azurin) large subunit [Gammaproteobacteria bacterium]|nr:arsenate reductase (azurin) large subunit [Gammaproteobacteria bacterium]
MAQPPVRVPLPPRTAERRNTVCQFCIVGCGYQVYKWPVGEEGGPAPSENALGVDFTRPLPPLSDWISTLMHSEVTDADGRRYHVAIVPDKSCPVNEGLASVRGGGLAQTLYSADRPTRVRLRMPMVAGAAGHSAIEWQQAVDLGARVIKAVMDRWGSDSVGMKFFDHGGGGGGFENNWAVGRFFFSGVGTRTASIHNRPAYNSEVHAAGDAGVVPLTNAYLDAQLADTILVVGANPYETQTNYFLAHMVPNLQGATLTRKHDSFGAEPVEAGRMIIVDPRRTMSVATAQAAGGADRVLHLQIEPGSDIALLNAIARVIRERRWHDVGFIRERTEWQTFESYQRSTLQVERPADELLREAAEIAGVPVEQILQAAEWIARPKPGGYRRRTLLHYEKGLIWGLKNYENVASIVDLGLLTGNIGKPGTGISRLGGHQEAYVRPPYPGGRPALNVDEAVRRGEVKAFWIGGCNPVLTTLRAEAFEQALIDRGAPVRDALVATEGRPVGERVVAVVDALKDGGMFLIAQDIYMTASAQHAHLVLPAAQWGEMNLTSINGERRLRLYERFMDPPGEAIPDWEIMARFGRRMRALYLADRNPQMANRFLDYDWKRDEDVFIHARYQFKGDATDPMESYAGMTYALLRELGNNGIQTPVRLINGVPSGTVRMHEDGNFNTPSGKARFIPAPRPWPGYAAKVMAQRRNHRFWVNNGRTNHVWQTLYHHKLIPFYHDRVPMPYLEMHPDDARELGIVSSDLVELSNDMGKVRAMAYVTNSVKPGHTFMLFGQPRGAVGNLVSDHVDPTTTIPYYKGAWADIRRIGAQPELARRMSFLSMSVAQ